MLIFLIVMGVVIAIMMGIFVFAGNLINSTFGLIQFNLGDQNFTQVYEDTLGQGVNAFLDTADFWGTFILFGMVLLMLICSFIFSTKKRLWIIAEVVILIASMILVVQLQTAYDILINSSSQFFDIYANQMTKTSTFILNLHIIIPIVWALMVIITYGILKLGKREDVVTTDIPGF